jgi:hypothetical protein
VDPPMVHRPSVDGYGPWLPVLPGLALQRSMRASAWPGFRSLIEVCSTSRSAPTQTMAKTQERQMPPAPGPPPDAQSIGLLIVFAAALCVIYWRIAIRLVAIAVIALTIYGAVLFVEAMHHS